MIKKRILAFLIFLIILLAIYLYACMVFMPKTETDWGGAKYYSYQNFKKEKRNTIDTVFFGDSDVYSGITPMELYRTTGFTSYVRSGPQESMYTVKKLVKETLNYQTPKFIMIDVDCMFEKNLHFTGSIRQKYVPLVAPIYYHVRWKELTFKDFFTFPHGVKNNLKGHVFNSNVVNYSCPDNFMQDTTATPQQLDSSVLKDFDEIVNFCNSHNIILTLFCLPTPYSWDNAKSNAISELAAKYGLTFLDLNLPQKNFNFNFNTYFCDNGNHVNIYGATEATRFIGNYLKENYSSLLTDHRSDPEYKEWSANLTFYNELLQQNKVNVQ